jgi:hypothetical protein
MLQNLSGKLLLTILAVMYMPSASAQLAALHTTPSRLVSNEEPVAPSALLEPSAPQAHRFWDRANILLFSGVAVSRAMDYASTKNMLSRGRQEILIPDDVVYSTAGFPALEAAATGTSIGVSYLLHRTGHHSLERWLSIGHIGVTDFGVARNYSLKSRRR